MNRFFLFALLSFALCSFSPGDAKITHQYLAIKPRLRADIHEVTNAQYQLFLKSLSAEKRNLFKPDSSAWQKEKTFGFTQALADKYHSHEVYARYPVVNISYEAMVAYCKWLTQEYHLKDKREFEKVVFRLPTEREWLALAKPLPGHNLPWYGNLAFIPVKGKNAVYYCANLKVKDHTNQSYNYVADGSFFTCKVGSYEKNGLGFFVVIGNVAEVTAEGTIKGGSWDNLVEESTVDQNQRYALPDPRVGFRVVVEILVP